MAETAPPGRDDPTLSQALDELIRSSHTGVLRLAEDGGVEASHPLNLVIDGADARLVGIAEVDPDHTEGVLFVPDEGFDAAEIMVQIAMLDPQRDAVVDRYQALFGRVPGGQLLALTPAAAKWRGEVFDGSEISLANPMRDVEQALLRRLNADRGRLAQAAERVLGATVVEPVAVSLDHRGIFLRTRTGPRRLPFHPPLTTPDEADIVVNQWLRLEI